MAIKLYTAEDLFEMPRARYLDLVQSRLVETPINGMLHGLVVANVASVLHQFQTDRPTGVVLLRSGYVPARDPDTVRGPDISFVVAERMPSRLEERYLEFAPDLAVEVTDPQDGFQDMRAKLRDYVSAGIRSYWAVNPETRSVLVISRKGNDLRLGADDTLDGGDVLPGFTTSGSALFPNP